MTNKPQRGGLRNPPGGRPPKQPAARKVKLSITLSQDTVERLRKQYPNEPISQVIERLLNERRNA